MYQERNYPLEKTYVTYMKDVCTECFRSSSSQHGGVNEETAKKVTVASKK